LEELYSQQEKLIARQDYEIRKLKEANQILEEGNQLEPRFDKSDY
jgi:hypothetical protein